jgi:hypothetical protein
VSPRSKLGYFRLTEAEVETLNRGAQEHGRTFSDYVRSELWGALHPEQVAEGVSVLERLEAIERHLAVDEARLDAVAVQVVERLESLEIGMAGITARLDRAEIHREVIEGLLRTLLGDGALLRRLI